MRKGGQKAEKKRTMLYIRLETPRKFFKREASIENDLISLSIFVLMDIETLREVKASFE